MKGGLLNLIAIGNQNIILTGNPTKCFFKTKYVKYTNFGLQKFRMDQHGTKNALSDIETKFTFKIKRHADLLMDTYLVVTLPNIWSPVLKYYRDSVGEPNTFEYRPYEFQWIKNIGTQLIKEVTFTIGGYLIQKFSGSYIQNMVERDYDANKKQLFNIMTGNIPELNDPANYSNRNNNYPNAFKIDDTNTNAIEPSIHSHQLFIPINSWFSAASTMALPLTCLQYAELEINFIFRPIHELYTIKDVLYDRSIKSVTSYEDIPRIRAEQSTNEYQFHRFIQEPPIRDISSGYVYNNRINRLDPPEDAHLIVTQCFLDEKERSLFAANTQSYLIKLIYEQPHMKINKTGKIVVESNGLVSNWMWYMQRNDVYKRNEWSNYTNWPYENQIPNNLAKLTSDTTSVSDIYYPLADLYNDSDIPKNIYITGYVPTDNEQKNNRLIMKEFAILCDGKYREDSFPAGVYNKIEKYNSNLGSSKEGLYCYNFSLINDPQKIQPSGAFNTNKFRTIEFEYNNYTNPPIDLSNVDFRTICDPNTGEIIATSKEPNSIYSYNYDLHICEERYNVLVFQSGTAQLLYSR